MRYLIASFLALVLSVAAATAFPRDADVFVIDRGGTIIGIGKTVAGEVFELELVAGFSGFAELTIVTPAGEVAVHEVMVTAGVVFLDLIDVTVMAREAGFATVSVSPFDLVAAEAEIAPRDAGMENASETGRASADDNPDGRADLGSGNAPEEPGRSDEAPRRTPERPAVPADSPAEPPEPPVVPVVPPAEPPEPPVVPVVPPVEPPAPPVEPVVPPVEPVEPVEPPVDPPAEPEVPPIERPVEPPPVTIDPPVDPIAGPMLDDVDEDEEEPEEE